MNARTVGPVVAFAVFLIWNVVGQSIVALAGPSPVRAAVMVALQVAGLALMLGVLRAIYHGTRPSRWLLAGIAAATAGQVAVGGTTLADDPVLLSAAVLFVLRPPWSVAAFAVVVAASSPFGEPHRWWIGPGIVAVTGGSLYLLGWGLRLARELRLARRNQAELAAVQERQAAMRELDGGVGSGLNRIAELLDTAAEGGPHAAAALDEVTRIARDTADEARRVAHGFRRSSLNPDA